MNQLNIAFTLFLSLLVEAMPFLLLGVLFSGLLLLFVDERKLIAKLPKNPLLGALIGSMVGFLFPVCECGAAVTDAGSSFPCGDRVFVGSTND